jgi:hypothetical protein
MFEVRKSIRSEGIRPEFPASNRFRPALRAGVAFAFCHVMPKFFQKLFRFRPEISPILTAWFALLLGIYLALWPTIAAIWILTFLLFGLTRSKTIFLLFFLLGGMRQSLELHLSSKEIPYQISQSFRVKIIQPRSFHAIAKIVEGPLEGAFVRVPSEGACAVGCELKGMGTLSPLPTYGKAIGLSLSLLYRSQNLIGKLKWDGEPERFETSLSLRDRLREKIFELLNTTFEPLHGFRRALVIGDTAGIDPPVWKAMNYLGLSHLLVISGSHLSFLILLLILFHRNIFKLLCIKKFFLARLLLLFTISFFYAVANADLSLSRAWFTCLIGFGAVLISPSLHRYKRTEILAWVGIGLLLWNSYSAVSVTYLLSFSATFALLQSQEWSDKNFPKGMMLFFPYFILTPLCFSLGLFVHPLSPLFNFIFFPIFGFILVPISFLSVVISSLSPTANELIRYFFEGLESLSIHLKKITPVMHLPTSAGIIFLTLCLWIFLMPRLRFIKRFFLFVVLSLLFHFCLWIPWPDFTPPNHENFTYQHVELGKNEEAILLKLGSKHILMTKGSLKNAARLLYPFLLNDFQNSIDLWVSFDKKSASSASSDFLSWTHPKQIWSGRTQKDLLNTCSDHICLQADAALGQIREVRLKRSDGTLLLTFSKNLTAKKQNFLIK